MPKIKIIGDRSIPAIPIRNGLILDLIGSNNLP